MNPFRSCGGFLAALLLVASPARQTTGEEFRSHLDAAPYREALSGMLPRIAEAGVLARSDLPVIGTKAIKLISGSEGERIGIKPGFVVAMLDGKPVRGLFPWAERAAPAEIIYHSSFGEEFRNIVPPGRIGVYLGEHFRPELALIRSHAGREDAEWWPHAVLGAMVLDEDPLLAETAWATAIQRGYPEDIYSAFFNATFAMQDPAGLDSAIDRFFARLGEDEPLPAWCQQDVFALLAATGRIGDFDRVVTGPDGFWSGEEVAWLKSLSRKSGEPEFEGDPLAYVSSRPFRILNPHLVTDETFLRGRSRQPRETFHFPVSSIYRYPGTSFISSLRPKDPVKNLHVRLVLRRLEIRGHHSHYQESLSIALLSRKPPARPRDDSNGFPRWDDFLIGVELINSRKQAEEAWVPYFHLYASRSREKWIARSSRQRQPATLHDGGPAFAFENLAFDLFRLGDSVFLYINAVPHARMPIDPDEDEISVYFKNIGHFAQLSEFTIREFRP